MDISPKDIQLIYFALNDLKFNLEIEKEDKRYTQTEIQNLRKNLHDCNILIAKFEEAMKAENIQPDFDIIPTVLEDKNGNFTRNIFL